MRKNFASARLAYFLSVVVLLFAAASSFAQEATPWSQNTSPLPPPTGYVNDYAGVIDTATKQALETKLKNFKETTNPSVEIAVAVVKTTGDRPIFDYSLAVARGWKIGSKLDNNPSALLFVAIDDRKYFTQISKDLEGDLPDGVVGSLQRQYLVPEFKKGNYGKGISDTIDAYISTIRNKGNAPSNVATNKPVQNFPNVPLPSPGCCCWVFIIFVIILVIFVGRRGGGGGVGSALPWIIGGALSNSGGSGSSSSGGWGGFSGGGGFGGFGGGGDFGGGGSGGDW